MVVADKKVKVGTKEWPGMGVGLGGGEGGMEKRDGFKEGAKIISKHTGYDLSCHDIDFCWISQCY